MKKSLLTLTALASLIIVNAQAEPVYGPYVKTWKDSNHSGTCMARHLTDAARAWEQEAKARGYSDAEITGMLRDALYQNHNTLPPLPEFRSEPKIAENQRTIAHGTMAAIGSDSLETLAFALCSEGAGKVEQGEMIIKGLIATGVAIDLNPGDIVTLRNGNSVPIHGLDSTVSGVPITYRGLDYILIVENDTFEN